MRLQRISFGRSDIPPDLGDDDCRGGRRDRVAPLDLELDVLRAAKPDSPAAAYPGRRDEPLASVPDQDEEVIEPGRVEALHQSTPTLIAAASAKRDLPAALMEPGACLYLHADEFAGEVCDEVIVRAMAQRNGHARTNSCQPVQRGPLSKVPLLSRREHPSGEALEGRGLAPYEASRSRCASGSPSSFLSVLFSIWRIRSRVTPKARPTSSSVRALSPVRP
jgi:hypothetical protein